MKPLNTKKLLLQYYKKRSPAIKNQLILIHKNLVMYLGKKMAFDYNDLQDIIQVGNIGLLKAIDRFEPNKNTSFISFAIPTIVGEIKHYLRDRVPLIRLPRKLKERHKKIKLYIQEYVQEHKKKPTINTISTALQFTIDEVVECLDTTSFNTPVSLDHSIYHTERSTLLNKLIGKAVCFEESNYHELQSAIEQLPQRNQQIIYYRFYHGFNQTEIAHRMNISQMHVSRLLRTSLKSLRTTLESST